MDNEACLIYSLHGESEIYGGDKTESLKSDEGVLMKCGHYINNWRIIETSDPYEAIAIHFYPEILKLVFEEGVPHYLKTPNENGTRVFQKIKQRSILKRYIDSLMVYFENPVLFDEETIRLKLRELMALLYNMNSDGIREILSNMFNPDSFEFKKVIKEHIYHDLTIQEYATLLNLSTSTFKRKFKAFYDTSPGKYFLNKRLERAKNLLLNSQDRVSDICFDSGFGDVSNFTKAFSKKYGMSPTEFRNSN
ncbi:MAG: AraC family transcriptional regulator [Bacteroidota bacterium]